MPPKSRQAQRDRAEASSLAVFLPAASAANAAPSTRNDLSPDVLRRAIERGDQAAIDRFQNDGGDVDVVFERGVTPLMLAAERGMLASVLVLLPQVDVAAVDLDGRTAADHALQAGQRCTAALLTALQPTGADGGAGGEGQVEDGQLGDVGASDAGGTALEQGADGGADLQTGVAAVQFAATLLTVELPGMTPLMLAARHGAVPVLRELLRAARTPTTAQEAGQQDCGSSSGSSGSGASSGNIRIHSVVNAVTRHGFTALHYAAECRHHAAGAAAARLLIAAGADKEVGRLGVGTPLTLAASCDNLAVVRVLLEAGADPRAWFGLLNANGPLLFASAHASAAVVKALLDAGATPRARKCGGPSALEMALARGAAEVALLLLSAGADLTLPDANGGLPSGAADAYRMAMAGHAAADPESVAVLARELVARGVPPNMCLDSCDLSMLNVACGAGSGGGPPPTLLPPCGRKRTQRTGGSAAARKVANPAAIRALLEAGANVGGCPRHRQTSRNPLHVACMAANGHEAAAVLLEAGADVNAMRKGPHGDWQTALSIALRCGTLATVELLLTRGKADPNLRVGADTHYSTPLMVACEARPEAVPLLLAAGADPNRGHMRVEDLSVGGSYWVVSPVILAAMKGDEGAVTALLEAGADPLLQSNLLAPAAACHGQQGAAVGRRGATAGRRSAAGGAGSTGATAAAVHTVHTEPVLRHMTSSFMKANEAKAHIRSLVTSKRVLALLLDAINRSKGRVSAQRQQQLEQQQQEQRARADEAAAQLLAEEEAEAERARASKATGSKAKKGKGAKGAGAGGQEVKGTAASPETDGVQKEADGVQKGADGAEKESGGAHKEADGVQKEAGGAQKEAGGAHKEAGGALKEAGGAEREAGGVQRQETGTGQVGFQGVERHAMQVEAAASVADATPAGGSSNRDAAATVHAVTVAEAAGHAAAAQGSVLRGSAALAQARGQPAPGPKHRGGEGGQASIPPAPAAVSPPSTPSRAVDPPAPAAPLPGHRAVAGSGPPSLAPSPLPTQSPGAVPLASASSPAVVPPHPSLIAMHDDGLCVVCMERRRSTVLVPCSHVVMCQACCDAVREARDECPMCREPIDAVLVVL